MLKNFLSAIKKVVIAAYRVIFEYKSFSIKPSMLKFYFLETLKLFVPRSSNNISYEDWITFYEPNETELSEQRTTNFKNAPLISILTPTFDTDPALLIDLVESIQAQTYPNWELCFADGGSEQKTIDSLNELAKSDSRIKIVFLDKNLGISENTIKAMNISTGEYLALVDHDDLLSPFAFFEVIKAINNNPEADFIYSDEDKIFNGNRFEPCFKSCWNPTMLHAYNYICHLAVFSRKLYALTSGFSSEYDGAQDYDLFLKLSEKAHKIIHIPKILYHWRCHENSSALNWGSKSYGNEVGLNALSEHCKRVGLTACINYYPNIPFKYICQPIPAYNPLVSIIIPNKDNIKFLSKCINSIINKSTYSNYEIIVIENNSTSDKIFEYYKQIESNSKIKILTWDSYFNYSAINNYAIKQCNGEYVILLNNDTEVITPEWIENMLGHAMQPGVGAVGAKLLYSDNTIQHAGVIIGGGGIARHLLLGAPSISEGYFRRAITTCDVSAVTAACAMFPKSILDDVNGLDEEIPVAFNDVDLCLRIRDAKYRIIWSAETLLYHHESKSRGYEDTPEKKARFLKEINYMVSKWDTVLREGDPYYSPNFTHELLDFTFKSPHDMDYLTFYKSL